MDCQLLPVILVSDAPGLDFLNSIATSTDGAVDRISDGEGFVVWLGQSGLAPADALAAIRARATRTELDEAASKARALREWFRGYVRQRKGQPLTPGDLCKLEPLNTLLALDSQHRELVASEVGAASVFSFRTTRRWQSAESLLMPIAEALARLVSDEDFTHVKACEGVQCTMMFVDRTRSHARRWCSMAACGNRAKVAAHRMRVRERKGG
jgi:predicted RNA-binding Zn ribbon-like protein